MLPKTGAGGPQWWAERTAGYSGGGAGCRPPFLFWKEINCNEARVKQGSFMPFRKKKIRQNFDKIASTVDWTGESGWMLSAHAICWVSWANSSHTEYVFINHESILNFNKLTCSSRLKELCFPTGYFPLITQGWCWTRPGPAALLRGPPTAWWHLETLSIAGKLKGWTEAYLWHHFGDLGNYGLEI